MQDKGGGSRWTGMTGPLLIAMLLVGTGLIGYSAYGYFTAARGTVPLTVQTGDQVLINYTGQYSNGLIFDTSMLQVASNNVTYPKAPEFTWRGASNYKPLNVTSVGNGQIIAGLVDGIIGMGANSTRTVVVPPSLGYGQLNNSSLVYLPVYQNITMIHTITSSQFTSKFGFTPATGYVFRDPFWGWNVTVLGLGNGTVTYEYEPLPGMTLFPYTMNSTVVYGMKGWPVRVVSVNSAADNGSGLIEVRNEVSPSMALAVGGILQNGSKFVLWSLNTNRTVTLDTGNPVAGRTLIFTVTVIFISNPTTGKTAGASYHILASDRARLYTASISDAVLSHVNNAALFSALTPS